MKKLLNGPIQKNSIRPLAITVILLFCFSIQSDLFGQVLTRIFDNRGDDPIELLVDGKVIATIKNRQSLPVKVNFGDRIDVNVPGRSELKWYPIYINEMEDRGKIKIKPRVPYDQVTWAQRGGRADVLFFEQNVNGIHIKDYDPFVVFKSFKSTRIFAGIHADCLDYEKFSNDRYLVDGFEHNGPTPYATGEKKATLVVGEDNFKNYFSTGIEANIPMGSKGPTLNAGFNYSKGMEQNIRESSYSFVSKKSKGIYSVAIEDLRLIRLSEDFIEEVELVLQTGSAKRLIEKYGTHYPVSVDYGGYYRSFVSIEESAYRKAEEEGWEVSAGVSASMQATEIKSGDPKEGIERTDKYGGGNVGGKISAAGGTSRNVANLINNSHSHYIYVGGDGGFNGWNVTEDNAGAIAVEMAEIYNLIYPHIMKTAWTAKECDAARRIIEIEFNKVVEPITSKPLSKVQKRVFKLKINNLLKVDEIDDFNKRMKGNISVNVNGATIPLWSSDTPMDMWKDGPNYLTQNKWKVISQESDANGNFAPVKFTFSGMLYEHDGVNDAYEIKMPITGIDGKKNPNEVIELKSINSFKEHKLRFRHDHWGKFVVDAVIKIQVAGGFEDKFETEEESITAIRSATTNSNRFNASPNLTATPIMIGQKLDNESSAGPAKEVKFHGQNGITMDQAKAIAAQNGWQIATSYEVLAAYQQHNLDVYAFGMMADGRFAVPVQKDHSNFKKGPNIGATGGNQGFFYTMPESTSTTTTATSSTASSIPIDKFIDLNATYTLTDAKHNLSLGVNKYRAMNPVHQNAESYKDAKWYFLPTGDGYYYIYDLLYNKALVATNFGEAIFHEDPNGKVTAQWKITPSGKAGQYIITNRKHNKSMVAGDAADGIIYHQPHNDRLNAYWTFTITNDKAPANKPDPNVIVPEIKGGKGPNFSKTPWLDQDFIRIQNKSNNAHYIHNQWGQLYGGPIQADWLSAQWKFIPYGGLNFIGNFQSRLNPELYLVNNNGKVEVETIKSPSDLQGGHLLWSILPENDGWLWIINSASPNESLQMENGQLKVGAVKKDLSNALWKVEFGPIISHGIVPTPPKHITNPEPTNVALNKPTKQSSVFGGHVSMYAVDGKIQNQSRPAHTLRDRNPWWEVDLGANYNISQINIFNITDERNKYRTHGLYILVSKTPFTNNSGGQLFADNVFPDTEGNYKGNVTGRYVRLYLAKNEYLNISEVQVMGIPEN